jgi:hypothetical protein
VSPVRYELGFYIPEDGIIHSHRRENLKMSTDASWEHFLPPSWQKHGRANYLSHVFALLTSPVYSSALNMRRHVSDRSADFSSCW